MKTKAYNPSKLEKELAQIILNLKDEISSRLVSNKIDTITVRETKDNPDLTFKLTDTDGDAHQIVVKIIQKVDQ